MHTSALAAFRFVSSTVDGSWRFWRFSALIVLRRTESIPVNVRRISCSRLIGGMAFSVPSKMSHDISSAFGKGLHGFKVEAMANQRKPNDLTMGKEDGSVSPVKSRAVLETVMLGIFTIMMAAVPLALTSVPSPELVLQAKEVIEEWCTPSTCFVVLIVGVLLATSGALGGSGSSASPEQNIKFTESYLVQRPVSSSQMDPSRMPEAYFSADAARQAHALVHASAFPVQAAQPASVMMPVSCADSDPPHPSPPAPLQPPERDDAERLMPRHDTRFESSVDERFVPSVEELFSSRVDDEFSPRVVEENYSSRVDDGFMPRATDERFSVNMDNSFPSRVEERHSLSVEGRFEPLQLDKVKSREEDAYEPHQEGRFDLRMENRYAYDDDETRSEFDDEPAEQFEGSEREEEHAGSEADDEGEAEPEGEIKYDSEDDSVQYSHVHNQLEPELRPEASQSFNRTVGSPPCSPVVPAAGEGLSVPPPVSPSQRQTHGSNTFLSRSVEAPPGLSSRRRPPTLPTVILHKISQTQPIPTHAGKNLVQEFNPKISSNVERESSECETDHPSGLSPPTPPEYARRPMSSPSSRSYAEFVKRTPKFSPTRPVEPPRPPFVSSTPTFKVHSPSKIVRPDILSQIGTSPKGASSFKAEKVETEAMKPSGRSNSSPVSSLRASFPSLIKQQSMPARRPREVRVVDDDSIDTDPEKQDDDVDQRTEAFLKKFREEMRLQRQESLHRHRRGESP